MAMVFKRLALFSLRVVQFFSLLFCPLHYLVTLDQVLFSVILEAFLKCLVILDCPLIYLLVKHQKADGKLHLCRRALLNGRYPCRLTGQGPHRYLPGELLALESSCLLPGSRRLTSQGKKQTNCETQQFNVQSFICYLCFQHDTLPCRVSKSRHPLITLQVSYRGQEENLGLDLLCRL